MNKKRACIIVHGKVQGVFFRAYTQRIAKALGLTGFVMNRPDGTVYIEAEGSEEKLNALIAEVKKGPPTARVEQTEIEWCEPAAIEDFQIRYA